MDTKRCFRCNELLPLDAYPVNRRSFCLKSDKGRNKVCVPCDKKRTIEQMCMLRFNFETNKFDRIDFSNLDEINKYYEENIIKLTVIDNTDSTSTKDSCPHK
jgi:hypothetical protein